MNPKEKIIIALDTKTKEDALSLVNQLRDYVGAFKIGLELFNSLGPNIIQEIQKGGSKIFYDAKFMDIPNTVKGAMGAAVRMNIWMVNIHCLGGLEMMRIAKETALETASLLNKPVPLVIGITLLTSIDEKILKNELHIQGTIQENVLRLAELAKKAGLDGVVCSGHEIEIIRKEIGKDFILVVPGIRPSESKKNSDQKRIMTPNEAISKGADYLVIGRPVTQSDDPLGIVKKIVEEISNS